MKFHNRVYELRELERIRLLCRKTMHFTIISGRRRVGKTELVKKFCSDKEHFYFFIGRKNTTLLLEELSSIAKENIPIFPTITKFDEWLEFLLNNAKKETIVFFDEFQNFKYVDESIFTDFQKVFDKYKTKLNLHIIVAGSHITLINKIFSDNKEPLFGRATEKYVLKPLLFKDVSEMLSEIKIMDIEEQIKWFIVFGGIPKYYIIAQEQGLERTDLFFALKTLLFRDFAPLKEEAISVLVEEFGSEHQSYFSILEAVALGNSEMTTIANKSGINIKSISKYLGLLVRDFRYLDYEIPVTEEKPWKSKKGRYFLSDSFLRFWFRYIYRNRSEYEIGNYDSLISKVEKDFDSFAGREFEKISKEFLIELGKQERSQIVFSKIGKWWKKNHEIDLIAINSNTYDIFFFECKWKELKEGTARKLLEDLKIKSISVNWNQDDRNEHFGVIAKKIENKEKLRANGYFVFDLTDFKTLSHPQ